MINQELDIDVIQYSDIIGELILDMKISGVVELFPQYTLILNKLRRTGIPNYLGIEPEYPERTTQAISYYSSLGLNGINAQVINADPVEYLKSNPDIAKGVIFISHDMDKKTLNLEELAKILYDITPVDGLNVHIGLEDDSAFIQAGFKKEKLFYLK